MDRELKKFLLDWNCNRLLRLHSKRVSNCVYRARVYCAPDPPPYKSMLCMCVSRAWGTALERKVHPGRFNTRKVAKHPHFVFHFGLPLIIAYAYATGKARDTFGRRT